MLFKGDYDRRKFYSLMGHFFAEKKYKKLMPYLSNDDDMVWNVEVKKGSAIGFISYSEKTSNIHIGYCYSEENKALESDLVVNLLNEFPNKNFNIELEKTFDKDIYLNLGFGIYKETTNYWYLEKKVQHENL